MRGWALGCPNLALQISWISSPLPCQVVSVSLAAGRASQMPAADIFILRTPLSATFVCWVQHRSRGVESEGGRSWAGTSLLTDAWCTVSSALLLHSALGRAFHCVWKPSSNTALTVGMGRHILSKRCSFFLFSKLSMQQSWPFINNLLNSSCLKIWSNSKVSIKMIRKQHRVHCQRETCLEPVWGWFWKLFGKGENM